MAVWEVAVKESACSGNGVTKTHVLSPSSSLPSLSPSFVESRVTVLCWVLFYLTGAGLLSAIELLKYPFSQSLIQPSTGLKSGL